VFFLNPDSSILNPVSVINERSSSKSYSLRWLLPNSWRWRKRVGDRVHAFFWSQAIRWGTSHRLIGGPRLKVGVDRRQIRPGENIEILARPMDADGTPAKTAAGRRRYWPARLGRARDGNPGAHGHGMWHDGWGC
jgi:hypothetical protein